MVADGKKDSRHGDEERGFAKLFASYVDQLNRGDELNPQEILAKHALVGEQLLACLENFVGAGKAPINVQLQTLGDYTLRRRRASRWGTRISARLVHAVRREEFESPIAPLR